MNSLPLQWLSSRLDSAIQRVNDKVEPSRYPDQLFNYVGLEHIESNTGKLYANQLTSGTELKSTKNRFHTGEILYGKLRPALNKVWVANDDGVCSTDIWVFRANDAVSVEYVAFFLRSPAFVERASQLAVGGQLPRISASVFDALRIPLPPLPEQQRIVAILRKADELRQLRRQANTRAKALLPALFEEMFGHPSSNPKGWDIRPVQSLGVPNRPVTKTGPFGSALKRHEYVEQGIPVWGIENTLENQFVEEGSLFITSEKYRTLQDYSVEAGDILVSRAGTTGRMCVARPTQVPSIIGTNLIRVVLDKSQIVPEYFSSLFSYFGRALSRLRAVDADASYSFISSTTIKGVSIPIPPVDLQRKFQEFFFRYQEIQKETAISELKLGNLFQSLLSRAFTGELTASWREAHADELALAAAERDRLLLPPILGQAQVQLGAITVSATATVGKVSSTIEDVLDALPQLIESIAGASDAVLQSSLADFSAKLQPLAVQDAEQLQEHLSSEMKVASVPLEDAANRLAVLAAGLRGEQPMAADLADKLAQAARLQLGQPLTRREVEAAVLHAAASLPHYWMLEDLTADWRLNHLPRHAVEDALDMLLVRGELLSATLKLDSDDPQRPYDLAEAFALVGESDRVAAAEIAL